MSFRKKYLKRTRLLLSRKKVCQNYETTHIILFLKELLIEIKSMPTEKEQLESEYRALKSNNMTYLVWIL